jgi:predicted Rossmann fold flavoprotein
MKKSVVIIGGGTAGLFLAAFLDPEIFEVRIFEKKKALGRKFLVAGDGGFNLTHGEALVNLKNKYFPELFLDPPLNHFNNEDLRAWLLDLDIPTFVGSSGRVFPEKGIKPIDVLKRIETFLQYKKVKVEFGKTFTGWNESNGVVFNENENIDADFVVFALGGGSWKVTGSDGAWLNTFNAKGITSLPFKSSNCAFKIDWDEKFIQRHEGEPLKNISISINNKTQKGEAVITKFGLEGNAIYALIIPSLTLLQH